MSIETERQKRAVDVASEQLRKAVAARKCHPCGCLHQTVSTLVETEVGREELAPVLNQIQRVLTAREYDCLGCSICYPALASNTPRYGAPVAVCTLNSADLAGRLAADPPQGLAIDPDDPPRAACTGSQVSSGSVRGEQQMTTFRQKTTSSTGTPRLPYWTIGEPLGDSTCCAWGQPGMLLLFRSDLVGHHSAA